MTDEPKTPPASPAGAAQGISPGAAVPPKSPARPPVTRPPANGATPSVASDSKPMPVAGPRLWPRVVGVLILVVGVGGVFAWQDPAAVSRLTGLSFGDGDAGIKALDARLARLEQRPAPDIGGLAARLDALEKRVAAQPKPDLGPLLARLDALEKAAQDRAAPVVTASGTVDLGPLLARLDALEKRAADPGKLDAVTARIDALAARDPAEALRARLDAIERQLAGVSEKGTVLARLDAAALALANGRKLGAIPGAPPALTRFANAAPPTEAALRLAFPAAVRAALSVSEPDTRGKPFLDRALARLQDFRFITVREGDHVLIGNALAETLAKAQTMLTAGDLDGAIQAVGPVSGPPGEKLAPWLADAKALAAARAALAAMAGNG